ELAGTGDLTPGSGLGFTLELSSAPAFARAVLLLGAGASSMPFRGATLLVRPILFRRALICDASGTARLASAIPAGIASGAQFVAQGWVVDPSAPAGLGASNGLRGTVP